MGKKILQWSHIYIYIYSNNESFYKLSQQYPKNGFSKDIKITPPLPPHPTNIQTNKQTNNITYILSMVVDDLVVVVVVVVGVVDMGRQHVAGGGRGG